ncbi:DinB family protein [Telmatocola sphagniphila]|uniref:DinB family protein n=1 Tax=Telmatocola sphagniphila TaxID=1123043 RepID=A0A8E6EY36_9BACT|nr:DinB family protein [Telmatocola sphagniphila]QVL32273.1 DinB family protein [Telmatocola sphagniphila]
MISKLIDEYATGAEKPLRAIEALSPAELDAYPIPGTWSIREIIIHLMDSDLVGTERMKRVIAMPKPLLLGYDETAFAKNLFYTTTDAVKCARVFQLNRELFVDVLRKLSPETFDRTGVHSENGLESLKEFVEKYNQHLEGHLVHLYKKRKLLGR